MLTCASVITELTTSRAVDRSSPTTMGMCSVPGSLGVMVDGNRPAPLCPVLSRPVDLSFVRYGHLVARRRLPGTWPLEPSLGVGLIPMLLWSSMVVRLRLTHRNEHIATKAAFSASSCALRAVSWPRRLPSALWQEQG